MRKRSQTHYWLGLELVLTLELEELAFPSGGITFNSEATKKKREKYISVRDGSIRGYGRAISMTRSDQR